ncbi:MAG: alanine/ornithine racemase family PLP-dependent enzyme [Bacteroidales bacterium]|nr:alanine/ornithine racemase family PLP-dependent enzyme [Bacteroidales bacterium]
MAYLELHKDKLRHNYEFLDSLFKKNEVKWGIVTKMLCGNRTYLKEIIDLGADQLFDSRISNLKVIKSISKEVETVYIKPPAKRSIRTIVKYADMSFNTDLETIKLLSEEAGKQKKVHKVLIMIELGDLREGVMGEDLINFYSEVFRLPNIEVVGLGANLNCLNGVMPTQDKLIQLSLYKQLIEATFNVKLPLVSGGASISIPMLMKQQLPMGVNHFRVGETLYFGNNLINGKTIKGMRSGVFKLYGEIIELYEKPMVPVGPLGTNVAGETPDYNEDDYGKTSWRAILDFGLLDINPKDIRPVNRQLEFTGASSDMLVYDLGDKKYNYKVTGTVAFVPNYMGALNLLNSNYITKHVV